jgi:hypothetical protein
VLSSGYTELLVPYFHVLQALQMLQMLLLLLSFKERN